MKWSFSFQLVGKFRLDAGEGTILPAMLSFETCKSQAVLKISSHLQGRIELVSGLILTQNVQDFRGWATEGSLAVVSHLCNFDSPHDLLSHLLGRNKGIMLLRSHVVTEPRSV